MPKKLHCLSFVVQKQSYCVFGALRAYLDNADGEKEWFLELEHFCRIVDELDDDNAWDSFHDLQVSLLSILNSNLSGGGRQVINIEPPLFPPIFHSFWRLHWQLYQIYLRTRISDVLHMIFRFCVWAHLRSGHELVFYLREIPTGFWRDLFLLFWGRFRLFRTCTWGFWHRALAPAAKSKFVK